MRLIVALALAALAQNGLAQDAMPVVMTGKSTNFAILAPRIDRHDDTWKIAGEVCRRPNRSVSSPPRIQIEHLGTDGSVVDTSYAYLPFVPQREDQRCGRYAAKLKSAVQPGETLRVCIPRGKGRCAAD